MPITFTDLTQAQRLQVAELYQQLEAINDLQEKINTERSIKEAEWRKRDNNLNAKKQEIQVAIRAIRQATVTDV